MLSKKLECLFTGSAFVYINKLQRQMNSEWGRNENKNLDLRLVYYKALSIILIIVCLNKMIWLNIDYLLPTLQQEYHY